MVLRLTHLRSIWGSSITGSKSFWSLMTFKWIWNSRSVLMIWWVGCQELASTKLDSSAVSAPGQPWKKPEFIRVTIEMQQTFISRSSGGTKLALIIYRISTERFTPIAVDFRTDMYLDLKWTLETKSVLTFCFPSSPNRQNRFDGASITYWVWEYLGRSSWMYKKKWKNVINHYNCSSFVQKRKPYVFVLLFLYKRVCI